MTSIQTILIAFCLLLCILASIAFRSRLGCRLLAIFFFLVAATFVVFPNATTVIANYLGVGRGTDLLLYIGLLAGIHAVLLLYLRTRKLEQQITEQVRAIALRDARRLGGN